MTFVSTAKEYIDHFTSVMSENRHIPPDVRKSKFAAFVDVKLLPTQYQTTTSLRPTASSDHDSQVYAAIKDIVTDPLFSPLMASDLSGLPPALVHICEFDVLRDDGFLYARRLQDANVPVTVHFAKGGIHGDIVINMLSTLNTGRDAVNAVSRFVKDLLGK